MKIVTALVVLALGLILTGAGDHTRAAETPKAEVSTPGVSGGVPFDPHILVDQFGYRPHDPKVAVIRNPVVGFDSLDSFAPGTVYELRRAEDGKPVYSGSLTSWRNGAVEASSGDSGWWFDFSAVITPGVYFVYDPKNLKRSATFKIDQNVYKPILKAATRMYFYQRSGFSKQMPFAELCWIDDPAYLGPGQDSQAHDITDRDNPDKFKDLSGGWFDAGDTDKYVTFAAAAVHQLLSAYEANPTAFTDDFNIPESGNRIPDVIDEVKWEIDWLKRMQYPDGSAALKVGEIVFPKNAAPSLDHNSRYYIPACTSATIAVAGMFAHASYVFGKVPELKNEAEALKERALAAWNSYQAAQTKTTKCDTGVVHSGNADWSEGDQTAEAVVAAVYLFAITADSNYSDFVAAHYRDTKPYQDAGWSRYKPEQGEALLFYAALPGGVSALKAKLRADKLKDAQSQSGIYGFQPNDDLYRAFLQDPQYHWGSNAPRANYGNSNLDALALDAKHPGSYEQRALEILHYFHGVNPLGMVYLTNMYSYGATRSANEIFHMWFAPGTRWSDALTSECGPAPGYVPGGPNAQAVANGVPASLIPPAGQPEQKSYRDTNAQWPESSWVITEPGIYYQSAYVKLLSHFAQ
jgi:hypothetical protein